MTKEAILQDVYLGPGCTEHATYVQDYVRDMWYTLEVLAGYFEIEKVRSIVEAGMPTERVKLNAEREAMQV
jgi:hypothetical protein